MGQITIVLRHSKLIARSCSFLEFNHAYKNYKASKIQFQFVNALLGHFCNLDFFIKVLTWYHVVDKKNMDNFKGGLGSTGFLFKKICNKTLEYTLVVL